MGVQINAITKSGTNTPNGHVLRLLPRRLGSSRRTSSRTACCRYQDQQLSVTFGGPIKQDRIHYFANYDAEHKPVTYSHSSPWNTLQLRSEEQQHGEEGGVRLDFQFTSQTRLIVPRQLGARRTCRSTRATRAAPSRHPSTGIEGWPAERQRHGQPDAGARDRRPINELKGGYSGYSWFQDSILRWPNHPQAPELTHGSPIINLRGYTVGQAHSFSYQNISTQPFNVRDDFTYSLRAGRPSRHEGRRRVLPHYDPVWHCTWCQGVYDATGGAPPANIEQIFPVWNDVSSVEPQRAERRHPVAHDRHRRLLGEAD